MSHELAIVGAGNMAEAIAHGILRAGLLRPDQMIAADLSPQRLALFAQLGVPTVPTAAAAVGSARRVLLSVKPQHMHAVLEEIAPAVPPDALIISIAAGISTRFIQQTLGGNQPWRVIRTMPNTPMLLGEGMVGAAPGPHATPADMADARRLFEAAARFVEVTEDQLDAVTAVSGSGPAYFFYLAEHMIRAAIDLGLSPQQAHELVTTTAMGAARMLASGGDTPEELRRKVTSPGGTTQAAIQTLEARGTGPAIVEALRSAAARSRELGR